MLFFTTRACRVITARSTLVTVPSKFEVRGSAAVKGTAVQPGHYRSMNLQLEQRQFCESRPSRPGRGIARLTHPFPKARAGVVLNSLVEAVLKGSDRAVRALRLVRFDHDTSDLDPA